MTLLACAAALASCTPDVPSAEWNDPANRGAPLAIESDLVPAAEPRTGDSLRIVSYNVEFGADVDAFAELFASPPFDTVDVFLIQEIESHPDEGASRAAQIASATGMAYAYLPAKLEGEGTHGMAILARRELANLRYMDLPYFGTSLRRDHRTAMVAEVDGIDVVNVHLRLQLGIAERILQLEPTTHDLAPIAVLGGDLNTNPYPWSDVVPVLPADPLTDIAVDEIVDDAMAEFGFDAATIDSGPTHETPLTSFRLDSIYSRGLEYAESHVERDAELSDHWPVWVDFTVPEPEMN